MNWRFPLFAALLLGGCVDQRYVAEHPVENQAPALKPGVYSIQVVEVRPVAIKEVEPDYPPELGSILTGQAMVAFTVHANGKVGDATVVQADDVLFGEAAVRALSKWRFKPAQLKGAPVECRMTLPFIFTSPYGYYSGWEGPPTPANGPPSDGSGKTVIQSH